MLCCLDIVYHAETRIGDAKWAEAKLLFAEAVTVFLQAVYLALWVFSRMGQLLQATNAFASKCKSFGARSDTSLVNLISHLLVACPLPPGPGHRSLL